MYLKIFISLSIWALNYPLNAQVLTSSEVTDLVKNVDSINNGQLTGRIAPMCINSFIDLDDKAKGNTIALYNKCAVDLCGLPGTSPSVFVTDDSYAKFLSDSTNGKINNHLPLIEKVVDKKLKNKKYELAQTKAFLENPQPLYLKLKTNDKIRMNENAFSKYVKTEYVKADKVKDRIKVRVMPPDWADDNFKKALNTYAENLEVAKVYEKGTMIALQPSFDEIKQHTLDLIFIMENELKMNPKLAPTTELIMVLSSFKEDLDKEGVTSYSLIDRFRTITDVKERMIEKSPSLYGGVLCDTSECDRARALYFKQPMFTQPLEKMSNEINSPHLRKRSINSCKAGIISGEIQEADEKKAKVIYQEALKLVKSNYVSKFSAHSKGLLENYLSSIAIKASPVFPREGEGADIFKVRAEEYVGEVEGIPNDESAFENTLYLVNNPDDFDEGPCSTFGVNVWDGFFSVKKAEENLGDSTMLNGKDHIYISPFSCQHSDHGKQVVAHEIGHALNSFFQNNTVSESSAKKFKDLRECAKKRYPNSELMKNVDVSGDFVFTEEDHADLIGYTSLGDKMLYSCSMLSLSATDEKSYMNLDFKSEYGDTHSSPFSRLLFEAINKNIALPQSCNDLIKEVKPEMGFEKCI